jgi:hypothetical protein
MNVGLLNPLPLLLHTILATIAVLLIFLWLLRIILGLSSRTPGIMLSLGLTACLGFSLSIYSILRDVNQNYDSSHATIVQAEVTGKIVEGSYRYHRYYLQLNPLSASKTISFPTSLGVSKRFFEETNEGTLLEFEVFAGRLDSAWYRRTKL